MPFSSVPYIFPVNKSCPYFCQNFNLGSQDGVTRVERICAFIPTVLPVLLPSLSILLCLSHLSCLAPLERGRGRMERKRTTMGEAAQIRCKSALPPMVYYPLLASQTPFFQVRARLPAQWGLGNILDLRPRQLALRTI